jgi:hypothetical protein
VLIVSIFPAKPRPQPLKADLKQYLHFTQYPSVPIQSDNMKSLPPDRTDAVKELEQRLLKKWNEEKSSKPAPDEKPVPPPASKKKK